METEYSSPLETQLHASTIDPLQGHSDQSWYRHSGQTGDYLSYNSSGSPNGTNRNSAAFSDTKRSSFDPRRITPTLHASLVSEILALRRDLETRNASIYDLETSLETSRLELESVHQQLNRVARDRSTNRRQADDAEKHLYKVTEDLIKERDEAVASGQELRARLNALTAKGKRQEQEFEKWQRDYETRTLAWESERRNLEHRLHTTENQLRTVVDEIQTKQVFKTRRSYSTSSQARTPGRTPGVIESPFGSPSPARRPLHKRNISILSTESEAFLTGTPVHDSGRIRGQSKTLADELDLDAVSDDDDGVDSTVDHPSMIRRGSVQPAETPTKARRLLGLDSEHDEENTTLSAAAPGPIFDVDTLPGITPLGSGRHAPLASAARRVRSSSQDDYFGRFGGASAASNAISPTMSIRVTATRSSATQTDSAVVNDQFRPPPPSPPQPLQPKQFPGPVYADRGTQMDMPATPAEDRPHTPQDPLTVPAIAIHPPLSAPTSPRRPLLPSHNTDASCQTDSALTSTMVDASIQTEEIRIDARRFRAHLLPGAVHTPGIEIINKEIAERDRDPRHLSYQSEMSQDTIQSVSVQEVFESLETRAIKDTVQRSLARSPDFRENDARAGDARDRLSFWAGQSAERHSALLSLQDEPGIRSGQSSMLARELRKSAISDTSTNNETYMLPSKVTPRNSREMRGVILEETENAVPEQPDDKIPLKRSSTQNTIGMRTSFRSRASSAATATSSIFSTASQPPPLPVPHRSSSRIHSELLEDVKQSPPKDGSPRKKRPPLETPGSRPRGIRKAHSSNSIKRTSHSSPPKPRRRSAARLAPIHSMTFDNDLDDIESGYEVHTPKAKVPAQYAESPGSPVSPEPALDAPLVDAIAAAMVGEWMWKYAQKRKSFGIADGGREFSTDEKKDNTRQRRWIWLSPYERTIMWSAKQPANGPALMGKAGRKLSIRTVLDVKDDNPLPKGANHVTCYERSIVVLTPERPLKITASSRERHYFWLMALSFLANPTQGPPQIPRLPSTMFSEEKHIPQQQLEHKDSVIEQSITKAQATQTRNFTAPSMSSFHQASHMAPSNEYNSTVIAGPLNSGSSAMYSHPDMPESVTDKTSMRRFRRGSASQQSLQAHNRRRSTTNPIRLPTALSNFMASSTSAETTKPSSSTGRKDTIISSPKPPPQPQQAPPPQRNAGMIRMTAFVDPSYKDPYAPPIPSPRLDHSARAPSPNILGPRTPLMPNDNDGQLGLGMSMAPPLSASPKLSMTERPVSPLSQISQRERPYSPALFKGLRGKKKGDAVSIASSGTEDRRRLGYVFDDHGRDPFRGFSSWDDRS